MYVNNPTNNQYSIPSVSASKPLNKETSYISASTVPITNKAIQETNVLSRSYNNVYPNFIRGLYNNDQSASSGSLTESFIRSRASLSPTYMQNEIATRYNMISLIPDTLSQIRKVNKIA
tara:strand:- start:141 stop:497 length:357 start_codon:yes stop_codon:yes gene_type:complete